MEQYKKPFHSFIQPLLNSLQFPTESTSFTPVMPLIDVVETIHNSYYFKKEITLLFETKYEKKTKRYYLCYNISGKFFKLSKIKR